MHAWWGHEVAMITPDAVAFAFSQWSGEDLVGLEAFTTASDAIVCLGRGRAIKVQSTTMDRKARFKAVDREFDLATRLPPDRRVALARLWYHDGQLSETGEEGEPVILMRRLDPTPVHDLPIEQLQNVAKDFGALLAAFHDASPVHLLTPALVDAYLFRETRLTDWALKYVPTADLSAETIQRLESIAERLESSRPEARLRLEGRAILGSRRDGHGDLHVENLFLLNKRATLFDPLPIDHLRVDDVSADTGRLAREFERILDSSLGHSFIDAYQSAGGAHDVFLTAREMLRADLYELRAHLKRKSTGREPARRRDFFIRSLGRTSLGEDLFP